MNDAVRKFFVEQFKVVSNNLLDNIDLRLFPYGNTIKNADNTYKCPYEDMQCSANRIHVCFKYKVFVVSKKSNFLNFQFRLA